MSDAYEPSQNGFFGKTFISNWWWSIHLTVPWREEKTID